MDAYSPIRVTKVLPEIPLLDTKAESINKLATSFASLADSLTRVNSNLQGFNNLSNNLSTVNLSQKNLLTPSDKSTELQIVNQSEKPTNLLTNANSLYENTNKSQQIDEKAKETQKDNDLLVNNQKESQFYSDISDIKAILYDFRDSIDKPSQAGSFHK